MQVYLEYVQVLKGKQTQTHTHTESSFSKLLLKSQVTSCLFLVRKFYSFSKDTRSSVFSEGKGSSEMKPPNIKKKKGTWEDEIIRQLL